MVAPAGVGDSASMTPNPISTVSARNVVPFGGDRRASRGPEPQPKAVSVLIAHGERLARAGLRFLIDGDDALAVAGEAATGEHAVALARRRLPDIVVIDLSLPGLDAVEATRQIVADPALSRTHVSRAMRKLDARDRAQLVVFAYQTGLATPGATALPTPAAPPRAAHPPPRPAGATASACP